ncbi:sulfurtransferase TusA family protein [Cohnella mopanensis]|uniref:sulfurtransferase TusA family protein n=1 Tax=Cohnella mopanensis TaxID=2911966 RepID=UPI001EF766BD|nr:sulfurtransferase TusA family protein [Cohnella mopanensis]
MTKTFTANQVLDCKGLACPMPIVKTKKAIDGLQPGEVIEMQATDVGSLADIQGWAKNTGHQYLGTLREGGVLKHFIRKASPEEMKEEVPFSPESTNDQVISLLAEGSDAVILDVREPAEFAFNHIPGAISIPLSELESRMNELDPSKEFYVICRTGRRSGLACQQLNEKGYKVSNVMPGMTAWTGPTEQTEQ